MPLFKFLRHGDLKENFKSTGQRDLNIKYTNFDQLKYWECHATYAKTVNIYWPGNKTDKYHLGGTNCPWPTNEREYRQLPQWGNDQHTKGNIVSYLNGVTTNTRKEISSVTLMG